VVQAILPRRGDTFLEPGCATQLDRQKERILENCGLCFRGEIDLIVMFTYVSESEASIPGRL
jgi:hypothetical protein